MSYVDLESGKVQVEVFTQTDAALAQLREQYAVVPDFATNDGYEEGKKALKTVTTYRTQLEKERKRIKAPYLDAGKIIDAEAKRITDALVEIETPIAEAKRVVDDREKRMKEERIAKLQQRIDGIRAFVGRARGAQSVAVAALIEEVDEIDTQGEFYELTDDAVRAQRDVLDELGDIYSDRLQQEESERARRIAEQEAAAQREEHAIEQRIDAIRMTPAALFGKPAAEIRQALERMEHTWPATSQFGDRAHESEDAHEQAMTQMTAMLNQAEQWEQSQAKAAQEARQDADTEAQALVARATSVDSQIAGGPERAHLVVEQSNNAADEKATVSEAIDEHKEKIYACAIPVALQYDLAAWCDEWSMFSPSLDELINTIAPYFE
jgi:hypothetical protein